MASAAAIWSQSPIALLRAGTELALGFQVQGIATLAQLGRYPLVVAEGRAHDAADPERLVARDWLILAQLLGVRFTFSN